MLRLHFIRQWFNLVWTSRSERTARDPQAEGPSPPKVSSMMRGDLANLSERKLMDCLTRLGYDIEIEVGPAKAKSGHLMLASAR